MLNVQIGKVFCEQCGKECTKLWGSRISLRSAPQDKYTFEEISEIEKTYGQKEFYLCVPCSLKLMGVKTLAEKESEKQQEAQQENPKETVKNEQKPNEVEVLTDKKKQ